MVAASNSVVYGKWIEARAAVALGFDRREIGEHHVVADVATGVGAVLRLFTGGDERAGGSRRAVAASGGSRVRLHRSRRPHGIGCRGYSQDATGDFTGVLQVVGGLLERDRVAALPERDHEIGVTARDGVADFTPRRDRIRTGRMITPITVRRARPKRIQRVDRDPRDVVVEVVGGERLEPGDEHLRRRRRRR